MEGCSSGVPVLRWTPLARHAIGWGKVQDPGAKGTKLCTLWGQVSPSFGQAWEHAVVDTKANLRMGFHWAIAGPSSHSLTPADALTFHRQRGRCGRCSAGESASGFGRLQA